MADQDLIFKIIAQDEYKAQMEEARAAVDRMTQAEKDALALKAPIYEAESKIASAFEQSTTAANKYTAQFEALKQQYADGKISQDQYIAGLGELKQKIDAGAQGFEGFKGTLVAVNAGIGIAKEVAGQLKEVYDQTIGTTIEYASKVKDLSVTLSLSTEETSKLVSIGRIFGVNTETLTRSLEMMTKRGMAPSLEGLVQLSDRVMAIQDPVARAKELSDLFGRAWVNLMPILEKGGAAIRAAGEEANKFGTVLNEKDVQAVEDLEIANNKLGLEVDALKFKLSKGLIPDLANSAENVLKLAGAMDGTSTAVERNQYWLEILTRAFGENSPIVLRAKQQIDDYRKTIEATAQTTEEKSLRANMALARSFGEVQTGLSSLEQGARNQAEAFNVLDTAMSSTTAKSNLLAASQTYIAGEMANLKTVMAGALQNELTNFNTKQEDLATKAAKVKEELDKLQASQGRAITTTSKHKLTANEMTLAQLELAKAQRELDTETSKGTLTTEQQIELEAKVALNKEKLDGVTKTQISSSKQLTAAQQALKDAQAQLNNNTDPLKQAKLAVEVDNLKEKLGQASGAVQGYVDNSKKIKELQGQYDEITKEVEANAKAHEDATRRILFGYAEQQLAVGGLTETEARALDALAVRWGLKSQQDIAAMQAIRDAALGLAKDGNINEFVGVVDRAAGDVGTSFNAIVGKVDEARDAMTKAGIPINIPVSADTKQAETDVDNAKNKISSQPLILRARLEIDETAAGRDARVEGAERAAKNRTDTDIKGTAQTVHSFTDLIVGYSKNAVDSAGKAAAAASSSTDATLEKTRSKASDVATSIVNAMSNMAIAVSGDLNGVRNLVDSLPTFKEFIYKITIKEDSRSDVLAGGAQHGADFYVPPNPRGGSGDYFPLLAAPGEHVVITPAGPAAAKPSTQNVTNNTYNLYDALAAKQVTEQQRIERLKSLTGAM